MQESSRENTLSGLKTGGIWYYETLVRKMFQEWGCDCSHLSTFESWLIKERFGEEVLFLKSCYLIGHIVHKGVMMVGERINKMTKWEVVKRK